METILAVPWELDLRIRHRKYIKVLTDFGVYSISRIKQITRRKLRCLKTIRKIVDEGGLNPKYLPFIGNWNQTIKELKGISLFDSWKPIYRLTMKLKNIKVLEIEQKKEYGLHSSYSNSIECVYLNMNCPLDEQLSNSLQKKINRYKKLQNCSLFLEEWNQKMDIASEFIEKLPPQININIHIKNAFKEEGLFQTSIGKIKGIMCTIDIIPLRLIPNFISLRTLKLFIVKEDTNYYGIFETLTNLIEIELKGDN